MALNYSNVKRLHIPEGDVISLSINGVVVWEMKLDTPQNVSVAGTVASCNDVQYATSYEYYVDDVLLGEYTPDWTTQDGDDISLLRAYNAIQNDDNLTIE